jgi:hypothetical protein
MLWLSVGLLLLFWGTRVLGIQVFPPFLDEGIHLQYSETILRTGPFARAEDGRQLTLWWYILLRAPSVTPIWTARVATLLAAMMGVAAVIGIGRLAGSSLGAGLAGLLYLFSTYHLFFERLALADPVSGGAAMLAVCFAYRLSRRAALTDAVLCGLALFIAVGAKVIALPYLGVPVAAALTLRPVGRTWKQQAIWCATALVIGAGLSSTLLGLAALRGNNPFYYVFTPAAANVAHQKSVLDAVIYSVLVFIQYAGLPAALLFLAALIWLAVRRQWYWLLCLFGPLLAYWFSELVDSRHLIVPITLLLVCGALALADVLKHARSRFVMLGISIVLAWGLLQWLPFAWTAAHKPSDLPLPAGDLQQYVHSDASGFAVPESIAYLRGLKPARVLGLLSNCQAMRYLAWDDFEVTCPRLLTDGTDIPALTQLLDKTRAADVYAVIEMSSYTPKLPENDRLTTIPRPGAGPALAIYRLFSSP